METDHFVLDGTDNELFCFSGAVHAGFVASYLQSFTACVPTQTILKVGWLANQTLSSTFVGKESDIYIL